MRRNIGGHADGNTGRAIDQQVGNARRHHHGYLLGFIVVGDKIDSIFLEIFKQRMSDLSHADFGVTHRRRRITVHRTKVTLTIDQHIAQRKRLRHAHDRFIDGGVTVRVIFTNHIADDTGGFLIGFIPIVAELVHGKQCTPMHRLEPVSHIGQCPANNHAHGIGQIGLFELVFDIYRNNFFC